MSGSEASGRTPGPARATGRLLALFLLANVLVFVAYRVTFLALYVSDVDGGELFRVLLYGLRLDLGLIGLEAATFAVVSVLALGIRMRLLRGLSAGLTLLNASGVAFDLFFYAQRNQHMGELLLANITDLEHLHAELASFVSTSPVVAVALSAGIVVLIWLGVRRIRRMPPVSWPLRRPVRGFLFFFPVTLALGLLALQPLHSKKGSGYELDWANSMHYSTLGRLPLHEAIVNPVQEIFVVHLPLSWVDVPAATLDEDEALSICRKRLRIASEDPDYPLLRTIQGRDLGIRNVIVIQVEGLTGSILEQREGDHLVTPYLCELAERGLYFPNTLQSYGNTAGGVFATVTGMPRTSLGEKHHRVFTRQEARTPYASLPRCLDVGDAWFLEGFRQSHAHYRAFAGNQGFTALTYADLHEILAEGGRVDESETVLGVHDGPLLDIALDRALAGRRPFVIHAITANTHFPWPVPAGFDSPIRNKRLRTFRYLDSCVRRLVDRLAEDPETHRATLLVVLADHTNITFGEDPMERVRIPLILHSPALEAAGPSGRREALACQADVLPTCLGLAVGAHRYAGIGRDLLAPEVPDGVLTTSRNGTVYYEGGFAFRWQLRPARETLHRFEAGKLGTEDVSAEHPEEFERLRRGSHATYETARRLAGERRVFPVE